PARHDNPLPGPGSVPVCFYRQADHWLHHRSDSGHTALILTRAGVTSAPALLAIPRAAGHPAPTARSAPAPAARLADRPPRSYAALGDYALHESPAPASRSARSYETALADCVATVRARRAAGLRPAASGHR